MFRNVPECSGMFHVPGFIDGPAKIKFALQHNLPARKKIIGTRDILHHKV